MSTNGTVVQANDLTRVYGEGETAVRALQGVSLDIPKGDLTAIMGPSGSGKSTLMHLLAGLDRPTSGRVLVGGHAAAWRVRPRRVRLTAPRSARCGTRRRPRGQSAA